MIGSLSRPLRLILVGSLALNLFGIGAIAADAIMDRNGHGGLFGQGRPPRFSGLPSPRELREVLPESDQAKLDKLLEANKAQFHQRLDELFAARQVVADAIKAEPFDRAKLETAFTALRERDAAMAAGAQDWLIEFVAGLDPAGRAKVAELLTQRRRPPDKPPENGPS
ncbi:MAG TPA: periplasmic heavy metal sensor [Candidatus Angelobacter sp.]|nr:periplasmic heavy metal sensor [Candidatus Angelobacter sp.]